MITIATNMAGRGTDIVLGGNVEKQIDSASRPTTTSTRGRQAAPARRDPARRVAGAARPGGSPPAACTSSAPSATSRGASTTSCAAAPAARATRARRASTCRSRIRCCASSPATGSRRSWIAEDARGRGDRGRHGDALDRERAAQGRGAQLRHPQAAARVRRRRQRPAQGHLPAAQRAAREPPTCPRRITTCARACHRPVPRTCRPRASRSSGTSRAWRRRCATSWQLEVPLADGLENEPS
jgi:hypothetical protein